MKHYLVLSHDEICTMLPYAVICVTREGAYWNTMTRKRRWLCEFTPQEREAASVIFRRAHNWYLVSGVPKEIKMTTKTLCLWRKLADFYASL